MACPMFYISLSATPTTIVAFGTVVTATGLGPVFTGSTYSTASGPPPPASKSAGTKSDPGNTSSSSVSAPTTTTTTTTPVSSVPVVGPIVSPIVQPVTGAAGLNKTTTTTS